MNKLFLLATVFVVLGCQDKNSPLRRWEAANLEKIPAEISITERKVSNTLAEDTTCKDVLRRDNFEKVLAASETERAKRLLPSNTTNPSQDLLPFFKTSAREALMPHPDHARCTSVPCLYDAFYGKDSLAGLYAYYWWLETNTVVAVSDQIPGIDTSDLKAPFLFKLEELRVFAELAMGMDFSGRAKTLRHFYRLPATRVWSKHPDACGLASANWVQFADGCMDDHAIRHSIIHEIAHHMDFSENRSVHFGISTSEEWMNISGWKILEVRDKTTGLIVERQWSHGPKSAFVTSYAGSSPMEDWAESTAYFKVQPLKMKQVSSEKSNVIMQRAFDGANFEPDTLREKYTSSVFLKNQDQFLERVTECTLKPSASANGTQTCFNEVISNITKEAQAQLEHSDPDMCVAIKSGNSDQLKASLWRQFNELFGGNINDPVFVAGQAAASSQFLQLLRSIDISEPYINCFDKPDPKGCYEDKINSLSKEKINPAWAQYIKEVSRLQKSFLEKSTFDLAAKGTRDRYRRMFRFANVNIDRLGAVSWKNCLNSPLSTSANDLDQDMDSTDQDYLHPAIRGCLQSSIGQPLLDALNAGVESQFRISDPATSKYLVEEFKHDFWQRIQTLKAVALATEERKIKSQRDLAVQAISVQLIADPSWIRQALPIENSCKGMAQQKIRQGTPVGTMTFISGLRFHPQEDILLSFSEDICAKVAEDPKVKILFTGSGTEQTMASYNFLRERIKVRAKNYAVKCELGTVGNFMSRTMDASQETICALKQSARISSEALDDWKKSPFGLKLGSDLSRATAYVLSNVTGLIKEATQ